MVVVGEAVIFRFRPRNARTPAGVFFLCAALGGCAHFIPQTAELRDRWPADLPLQTGIADVPFFPQVEYQCGPAALATALAHAGVPVKPDDLVDQVYIPARKGSVAVEMLAAPRRYGMVSYALEPRLEDVLREVAAGVPVVILQNYGRWPFKQWHYAVVVGYDSRSGNLVFRSGETRELREHIAIFEYTWQDSGRWAMVALPPGRIPATAGRARYFNAIVAMERAGQPRAAAAAYETFLARWPDDLGASVGLANARHALGDFDLAEAALRQALEHHPDSVVALNNLAQTLSDAGRSEEALELIDRAAAGSLHQHAVSETRALILQRLQRN
jgi:hypothetical protein